LAFVRSSLILANNVLPLSAALALNKEIMVKLSNVLVAFICIFSINTYANEEIDKLTLPIMEAIHKGEISNVFSMAFPKGSSSRRYFSDSDIEKYDNQFQNSFKTLGKSSGYFEYLQSDIPGVLVLKYFVVKFDVEPAIIKFVLYKQDKKWRINSFQVDDTLDDYLEESAKYRMGSLGHKDVREEIKLSIKFEVQQK
jgi:hypothetical protein